MSDQCRSLPPALKVRHPPDDVDEAVVVVSCLCHEGSPPAEPYSCHPNRVLWAGGRAEKGVASGTFKVAEECTFQGLAIRYDLHCGMVTKVFRI